MKKLVLMLMFFVLITLVSTGRGYGEEPIITKENLNFGKYLIEVNKEISSLVILANEKITLIPIEKFNNEYITELEREKALKKEVSYAVIDNKIYLQLKAIYSYDIEIYDKDLEIKQASFVNISLNNFDKIKADISENYKANIINPISSDILHKNRFFSEKDKEEKEKYYLLENKTEEAENYGSEDNRIITYYFKRKEMHKISDAKEHIKQIEIDLYNDDSLGIYYRREKQKKEIAELNNKQIAESFASAPAIEWERNFGGSEYNLGHSVQQTSDGGYIIIGYTVYGADDYEAYLIKANANGNKEWEKSFGRSNSSVGYSVQQTSDLGYIISGKNKIGGWLIKTNANGNKEWERAFGGISVQQTSDGGYIVTGERNGDVWLIKTNANGNEIWNKTFEIEYYDLGSSVRQTSDGGYIIAGLSNGRALLIKTSSSGDKQWNKIYYGDEGMSYLASVEQTSDEGYVVTGSRGSYYCGENICVYNIAFIIKTDANGNEIWNKDFDDGRGKMDIATSIIQTNEGGYAMLRNSEFNVGQGYILVRTDSYGNLEWEKTFVKYPAGWGAERSVQQTSDGGYIITGEYWNGVNNSDFWLVKLAPDSIAKKPANIALYSSSSYSPSNAELKIEAYAYDLDKGNEIKRGNAKYIVSYANKSERARGNLAYSDGRWKAKTNLGFLETGVYIINVTIEGKSDVTRIVIVPFFGSIEGFIKDINGNAIENANVMLYNVNDYITGKEYIANYTSKSNGFFAFTEIEPGYYVIVGNKNGYEKDASLSFFTSGGTMISKELVLRKENNLSSLIPSMLFFKSNLIDFSDYETELLAYMAMNIKNDSIEKLALVKEASRFTWTVISKSIQKEFVELGISVVAQIGEKVIEKVYKDKEYAEMLGNGLEASKYEIKESIIEDYLNDNDINSTLMFIFNESLAPHSKTEIKNTLVYSKSINKLGSIYNAKISKWGNKKTEKDFSIERGKQVIAIQDYFVKKAINGTNYFFLLNKTKMLSLGVYPYHSAYWNDYLNIREARKDAKITGYIRTGAGVIALISSFTGVGAVIGAGTAATIHVISSAVTIYTGILRYGFISVRIITQVDLVTQFAFGSVAWAGDVVKMPLIYNDMAIFLEKEADKPYYLNKSKNFKTEIKSFNLNEDMIIDGKKILILPEDVESKYLKQIVVKNASLTLKNTGERAEIKTIGKEMLVKDGISFSDVLFFNNSMNKNEELTKNIEYFGYYLSVNGLLKPHVLNVEVYSGPFITSQKQEYYYVTRPAPITSYISASKNIESIELNMRTEEKKIALSDYAIMAESLDDNNDISTELNAANPNISFNYNVDNNSYSIEIQFYATEGIDADLHVYENKSHVGWDYISNSIETGFPASYNGKENNPEIIYIPNAGNKTYKIEAKLLRMEANLSVPINIHVLKTPMRPAILASVPAAITAKARANETLNISFEVGEAGEQKPIENASISITMKNSSVKISNQSFFFQLVPAGMSYNIETSIFMPYAKQNINYSGIVMINSSAGALETNITIISEKARLFADTNDDCRIDIFDLAKIGRCYGLDGDYNCFIADINEDSKIDIFDLATMGVNYGKGC